MTETKKVRPNNYFNSVRIGQRSIDMAVIFALFFLALLGFRSIYGVPQYFISGTMGLLLGTGVALLAARFRWGPLRITPLMLLIYMLLGNVFAVPAYARWGFFPTLRSLWELIKAPVTTWKSVLTLAPPMGAGQNVLAAVWISTLLLSLFGMSQVLRSRRFVIAWLFPIALLALSIVFGTNQAVAPIFRGVLFAVISAAWMSWRFERERLAKASSTIISDSVRPGSWKNPVLRRRVLGSALILLIALGGTAAARPLLTPPEGTQRFALRDSISPPFDPREFVSPLADFRGYKKTRRGNTMFTITGVQAGEKIRLATLDQYDLHVYNVAGSMNRYEVSGAFLKSATKVEFQAASEEERASTITIGDYHNVWLPTVGTQINRIDPAEMPQEREYALADNLFFNEMTQTAVQTAKVRSGDSYTLHYEPYKEPTTEQQRAATFDTRIASELPENKGIPADYAQIAEEWRGDSPSDYEQVQNLIRGMRNNAYYSNGIDDQAASLSGHSLSRLNAMFEEASFDKEKIDDYPKGKIGDEEQFSVLAAVLLRELGIPARVVMGFEAPSDAGQGDVAVTGDDVTAWIEVAFKDLGWVRFDVAPEDEDQPVQPKPREIEKPRPQVAQPPPPPVDPPAPPPSAMGDETKDEEEIREPAPVWVIYASAILGPLMILLGILLGIVLAKRWRRRIRRRQGDVPTRMLGGWFEFEDLLADAGVRTPPASTRAEIAETLAASSPDVPVGRLAYLADRAHYGPADLPPVAANEYWQLTDEARRTMRQSLPWHRRLGATFSTRSFRRRSVQRRQEQRRLRALRKERARQQRRAEDLHLRRISSGRGGAAARARKGKRR